MQSQGPTSFPAGVFLNAFPITCSGRHVFTWLPLAAQRSPRRQMGLPQVWLTPDL
jgi:hypothetical protein